VGAFDAAHAGVRDDGGAVVSTLYEKLMAGMVPARPTVVRTRAKRSDRPWWVIYPDDTVDRYLDAEDARVDAHAWEPYSHERLTNG
jgi:hypothetical protein